MGDSLKRKMPELLSTGHQDTDPQFFYFVCAATGYFARGMQELNSYKSIFKTTNVQFDYKNIYPLLNSNKSEPLYLLNKGDFLGKEFMSILVQIFETIIWSKVSGGMFEWIPKNINNPDSEYIKLFISGSLALGYRLWIHEESLEDINLAGQVTNL